MTDVIYGVSLIPQPDRLSCWAGSMAMLLSFRREASYLPEQLANDVGMSLRTSYGWDLLEAGKKPLWLCRHPAAIECLAISLARSVGVLAYRQWAALGDNNRCAFSRHHCAGHHKRLDAGGHADADQQSLGYEYDLH